MKYSDKEIQLFNEAGINIEDKNYTSEEVEILKREKELLMQLMGK